MKVLAFYFCFFLIPLVIYAQTSNSPTYTISPRFHYGFIWNFSDKVSHLANQHMPAFEIDVTKQTNGNKSWQQEYRYPQVGYSLYYFSFDPAKPVGNSLVLLIHAGKNVYKRKRSNLQWRLGSGFAYVEKRFDVQNNFRNNVISQRINFVLNGQLNFNYKLSSRLLLNLGIGIVHISNGAIQKPNFGINLPTLNVGIGFNLAKDKAEYKKDSVVSFKPKTYLHMTPFAGLKEVYPVNGPKYFIGGINACVERRMNRKSGLNIGVDFSYDHSKKSEIAYDSLPVKNTFLTRAQAGFIIGHELYINKLSLLTQVGAYVYDPTHINKAIYQKVGLKYYISDKIFISMIMKIHLGVADWVEFGGGIRL